MVLEIQTLSIQSIHVQKDSDAIDLKPLAVTSKGETGV